MFPIIPVVALGVSAVALIRRKSRRKAQKNSMNELVRFAETKGITINHNGRFNPDEIIQGKPLLFYTIQNKRLMSNLLEYGANPNIYDVNGIPAIIEAVCKRSEEGVETLLKFGANPNAMDTKGKTAIFYATSSRMLEILKDAGADFNAVDDNGNSALFYSLPLGTTVKLIQLGADIHAKDKDGKPLLFYTIQNKRLMSNLLEYGANPNICNVNGIPAIIEAVCKRSEEGVETLLKFGANPNAMDTKGKTAIFYATSSRILEILKDAGANFNAVDSVGNSALFYSLPLGATTKLVELGADIHAKDKEGNTLLFSFSNENEFPLLKQLENLGLDINTTDIHGKQFKLLNEYNNYRNTIEFPIIHQLDIAVDQNNICAARQALAYGANPNIRHWALKDWNMIYLAVNNNNPDMIKILAKGGCDVNNSYSDSNPLTLAVLKGYAQCFETLLELGAYPMMGDIFISLTRNPDLKRIYEQHLKKHAPAIKDNEMNHRLDNAVESNDINSAKEALTAGANPNTKHSHLNEWNMIYLAVGNNNPDMIRLLAQNGCDINNTYSSSNPLILAAMKGYKQCFETLLQLGAFPGVAYIYIKKDSTLKAIFNKYHPTYTIDYSER